MIIKSVYRNKDSTRFAFFYATDEHVELQRAKLLLKSDDVEFIDRYLEDYSKPLDERVNIASEKMNKLIEKHNMTGKKIIRYGWLI